MEILFYCVLFYSILGCVLPLQEVALRQSPPSFSVLCCPCPYRSLLPHNVISPTTFWSSSRSYTLYLPLFTSNSPSIIFHSGDVSSPFPCRIGYVGGKGGGFIIVRSITVLSLQLSHTRRAAMCSLPTSSPVVKSESSLIDTNHGRKENGLKKKKKKRRRRRRSKNKERGGGTKHRRKNQTDRLPTGPNNAK